MKQRKVLADLIRRSLLLVAIAWLGIGHAQVLAQGESGVGDVNDQLSESALEAFSSGLKSLRASFEQSSTDGAGYVIEQLDGVFYFQAPDRFRWAYSEPTPELIVGDGKQLWHFDPSLEQATVRTQPPARELPILALTDPAVMAASYAIMSGDQPSALRLMPKDPETPIAEALVQMEEGRPVMVEWVDEFGQRTRIVFHNMKVNEFIEPGMFEFVPPAGVDVLEGL